MEIQILLDKEDFDDNELFGEIRLLDGQNAIIETNTYIESWISGLKEATNQLSQNSKASIDLIEEPNFLVFEKEAKRIKISYGEMFVYAKNTNEIESAIQNELKRIE